MSVYSHCLSDTSSEDAPWYVIPADDKHNARLIISQIVLETLADLKMAYPQTTPERHEELESFRNQL